MRINLKAKLIILIISIIVLSNVVLGLIAIRTSTSAMETSIHRNLSSVSGKVAKEIADMNEKEFGLIRGIANFSFVRDGSLGLEETCRQLRDVIASAPEKYENVSYYNAEGFSYNRNGIYHSSAAKDYFQAAMSGKEFVCDPFYSDVGQKVLQIYSVPVYDFSNKISGVVVAILYGDRITETIKKIDIGAGFHPAVMNRSNGQTIANANEGTDAAGNNVKDLDPSSDLGKAISAVMSGATGSVVFEDPSIHKKMVASYQPVEGIAPWSVFCVAPYDFFFGEMNHLEVMLLAGLVASVVLAFVIGLILVSILIKPLLNVKNAILDIASGNADLTKRLPMASNDEIGDVVTGFNQFVEKLQTIVSDIQQANSSLDSVGSNLNASISDTGTSINEIIENIQEVHGEINNQTSSVSETAGAVNEIASNIESLERMIERQSGGVSQASSAVEQMIGNITSVNNSMDKMADSFEKLAESAQTGASLQQNAAERMDQIKVQSDTLQEANLAIAAIAEQTNLLAMNAAIEAAHAGEAGKGFSVVADEIRKLSETSGEQSKTIGNQLTRIRESIDNMVDASQKSSRAFQDVTSRISETDELVRQIKSAMEEQTVGSQQITDALHSMNDSTIEVKNASKEMAEGNKAILKEVENLQEATSGMKGSMENMLSNARKISETGAALEGISSQMRSSISNIGTEINQFKV